MYQMAFLPLCIENCGDSVRWYWHKLTDRLWNVTQLDSVTEFYVYVYLQMIDSRHLCQSDFWSIVRGPATAIETFYKKISLIQHTTKTCKIKFPSSFVIAIVIFSEVLFTFPCLQAWGTVGVDQASHVRELKWLRAWVFNIRYYIYWSIAYFLLFKD